MVMSSPLAGAEMITFLAPPLMCFAASSALVKRPVDSSTISTPRSFHGSAEGSFSAKTRISSPSTEMPFADVLTSPSYVRWTESYLKRCASVLVSVRSFTATKSRSATPCSFAARTTCRPIRPKPLIPTRIAIARSSSRKRPVTRGASAAEGDIADDASAALHQCFRARVQCRSRRDDVVNEHEVRATESGRHRRRNIECSGHVAQAVAWCEARLRFRVSLAPHEVSPDGYAPSRCERAGNHLALVEATFPQSRV